MGKYIIFSVIVFSSLISFCSLSYGQDCNELKLENKQLKRELSILKAENAELIMEAQAQKMSNEFLRGKNDNLIDEIVPMRFWNNKYEKMKPRITALENEAQKLREDSIKYIQAINQLKDGQEVESLESMIAIPNYMVNKVKISRIDNSNIDTHFYLETLNNAPLPEEDVLVKIKILRKTRGNWEQVVYGEKGSKTYDKYYKLKFCKAGSDNMIRYHSINNFGRKKDASEYQVEFYHKENIIGTHRFSAGIR